MEFKSYQNEFFCNSFLSNEKEVTRITVSGTKKYLLLLDDRKTHDLTLLFDIKENSSLLLKLFISSSSKINIFINHEGMKSISNIHANMIAKNETIDVKVTSRINEGIKFCETHEYLKGIITGKGKINHFPILDIFDNDNIGSHSSAIGHFDIETLFYLNSRGLSNRKAIKLLYNSYKNEILDGFNYRSLKKEGA
ncbi:MAG: SufD family Fe-S cluster assembly protein [Acholeplasmatales bacterium]|jgi:hypothetical protein|nr:SufD family Fe-S cluster assembly protein [Acholeplasmatales bacterium]